MASFHCSVKVGKVGSGGAHAEYIEREEKYESKKDIDLEEVITGNLPEWAESSIDFFRAADENERINGSSYREFEIALPREFTKAQRAELVREFIAQELGDKHAYTAAIHNPKAAIEGGEQPHAHIMFSERTRDGIERPRDQYFKRYNAKNPEKGGAKKAIPKDMNEKKEQLIALRERFAVLQNKHLERHGYKDRVTHLSLKAQGITRAPEPHFGPAVGRAAKLQIRADRDEVARAQRPEKPPEVVQAPPVQAKPSLEEVKRQMLERIAAKQERERAEIAKAQALEKEQAKQRERDEPRGYSR